MFELLLLWLEPLLEKAIVIIPSAAFFIAFISTFSSWKISIGVRTLTVLTLKRTFGTLLGSTALFILIVVTYNLGKLAFPTILG